LELILNMKKLFVHSQESLTIYCAPGEAGR
jgi:hypothetical protein